MANTTSGTVTFDKTFAVDEIIEEAYERIGLQSVSGYQLKTARRSLNILFQEWGNRSTYSGLANKLSKGTPSRYFVQRFVDKTTVTLYTTPDSTAASKDVHIYFVKRVQDVDATYTDATDVPFRFVPFMASGLAFYLSQKYAPQRTQELKLFYEDELARALSEDGSSTSVHILPKTYYPGT